MSLSHRLLPTSGWQIFLPLGAPFKKNLNLEAKTDTPGLSTERSGRVPARDRRWEMAPAPREPRSCCMPWGPGMSWQCPPAAGVPRSIYPSARSWDQSSRNFHPLVLVFPYWSAVWFSANLSPSLSFHFPVSGCKQFGANCHSVRCHMAWSARVDLVPH